MTPRAIISVAVLALLAVALPALADPYSITPWVKAKQSYSDNIQFSVNNSESDFITDLTGGLTLAQDLERLKTNLTGQFNQFLYWDNHDLNSLDYSASGRIRYRVTERAGLNASARYAKDSQRDRDTDTTGLLVTGDRKKIDLSLGGDYALCELSRIEFSLDFGDSDREETNEAEDNKTIQANITYQYDLSEYFKNTVALFNFMYLNYKGDEEHYYSPGLWEYTLEEDYSSDVYQFVTGFSHNISELFSLFFQAGVSYTQTTEQQNLVDRTYAGYSVASSMGPEYETDSWGGVLSAGIDFKNEYWTMGLALSHDMQGATGTSGVVERTRLSGNLDRKISDKLSLTFRASAYMNKNERETTSDTDELTFNLQPGFRYRLKRDFILSGAWRFTTVDDREDDTSKTRNLVYFDIKKEFDLKDF